MVKQTARTFKPRADVAASKVAKEISERERYFFVFVTIALLFFGTYQSVLYFGHKVIPISDFPAVVRVGHELLSFRVPSDFKTAPVVGILQASLSYFVGGQHSDLTAGWLLNALLHPFCIVLFWQVGKRIIGRSASWYAIIAGLNPWVIYMLREPILETGLLFFTLVTFYFIFRGSKWSYFFASITTMVRYEGSALIVAAFVMDMIYSRDSRERFFVFLYSAAAAIPLVLWLAGTVLNWEGGTSHYFNVLFTKEYAKSLAGTVEGRTGLLLHMRLIWQVGFMPLLMPWPGSSKDFGQMVWQLSKFFAVVSFFFGSVYGLYKRQWKILALLIFFVPYFLLHARYPYPLQRYHTNIFWIALLICWYGIHGGWLLVNGNGRVPRQIVAAVQILAGLSAVVWFFSLIIYLPRVSQISPRSASLPYVAMGLVGAVFAVRLYICGGRYLLRELCIMALLFLVIASNQFSLVRLVGDGRQDMEFKFLANWYVANSRPGEKLAVYMNGVVELFAPKRAEDITGFPEAGSPEELIKNLYEGGVTYVVWASREGLNPVHTGYRKLKLDTNIAILREPKDIGPYQFVTQLGSERGFVNVFRLRRATGMPEQKSAGG